MATDTDIITATITGFVRLSGISRSKTYLMLDSGELESIHVGSRRLILISSYRKLIEQQRATGQKPPRKGEPDDRPAA